MPGARLSFAVASLLVLSSVRPLHAQPTNPPVLTVEVGGELLAFEQPSRTAVDAVRPALLACFELARACQGGDAATVHVPLVLARGRPVLLATADASTQCLQRALSSTLFPVQRGSPSSCAFLTPWPDHGPGPSYLRDLHADLRCGWVRLHFVSGSTPPHACRGEPPSSLPSGVLDLPVPRVETRVPGAGPSPQAVREALQAAGNRMLQCRALARLDPRVLYQVVLGPAGTRPRVSLQVSPRSSDPAPLGCLWDLLWQTPLPTPRAGTASVRGAILFP